MSDQPGAQQSDPNLVNAWGIAMGANGFWIADNGTGFLSVYDGNGTPAPASGQTLLEPGITGILFNPTDRFVITPNGAAPATFLVASETGRVWGVNPSLSSQGVVAIDGTRSGAIYKGLTIVDVDGQPVLLVADFHNAVIAAYNSEFEPVSYSSTMFQDPQLPAGFAPFNVVAIDNKVYVMYAQQDADAEDEVRGPGLGAIDVYEPTGTLITRLATGGLLNAPWALTRAPADIDSIPNALLVGNFGDGRITAIDESSGRTLGQLGDSRTGELLSVDGLWGLSFGNGSASTDPGTLYFAAGPNDEANGLYGRVGFAL